MEDVKIYKTNDDSLFKKFFPYVKNERSMLYIGNLVEFVRLMIENEEQGIFFTGGA